MTTTTVDTRQVKDLTPSPLNPRTSEITEASVAGLADSIVSRGLLQRILIYPDGEIIAGHRRFRAIQLAIARGDLPKSFAIPVEVRERGTDDANDLDGQIDRLIENLQRRDLDPMEEAWGYHRLIEFGRKQADLATAVGMSKAHVSKRLALLRLHPEVQDVVAKGEIPLDQALALASIRDVEAHPKLAARGGSGIAHALEQQKREDDLAAFHKRVVKDTTDVEVVMGGDNRGGANSPVPQPPEGKDWEEVSTFTPEVWPQAKVPKAVTMAYVFSNWGGMYVRLYKPITVAKTEVDRKPSKAEAKNQKAEQEKLRQEMARAKAVRAASMHAMTEWAKSAKKADVLDLGLRNLMEDFCAETHGLDGRSEVDVDRLFTTMLGIEVDEGDAPSGLIVERYRDGSLTQADVLRVAALQALLGYNGEALNQRILDAIGFDPDKVEVPAEAPAE